MADFQELVEILKQEAGCYRELIKLASEQKDILVSGKIDGLKENVGSQEKKMFLLGPLSEERFKCLERIGRGLGSPKMKMEDLLSRSDLAVDSPLRASLKDLIETVRELDAVNKTNGKLLENAQAYVKVTLDAFEGKMTVRPEFSTSAVEPVISRFNSVV